MGGNGQHEGRRPASTPHGGPGGVCLAHGGGAGDVWPRRPPSSLAGRKAAVTRPGAELRERDGGGGGRLERAAGGGEAGWAGKWISGGLGVRRSRGPKAVTWQITWQLMADPVTLPSSRRTIDRCHAAARVPRRMYGPVCREAAAASGLGGAAQSAPHCRNGWAPALRVRRGSTRQGRRGVCVWGFCVWLGCRREGRGQDRGEGSRPGLAHYPDVQRRRGQVDGAAPPGAGRNGPLQSGAADAGDAAGAAGASAPHPPLCGGEAGGRRD